MAIASEIGKQLVARTPEVAGGVLRQIIDFAIDGNDTFPGAKAAAAKRLRAQLALDRTDAEGGATFSLTFPR